MSGRAIEGDVVRALRTESGLRQSDVAGQLGISRTTLANIEAGRERIAGHLVERLMESFPEWRESLDAGHFLPSLSGLNPSLVIAELSIAYIFLESRSPSEIIQIRRVRATRSGAQQFCLGLRRSDEVSFTTDTQVLWGGHVADEGLTDDGNVMQAIAFPKPLRAGQVHEFAIRSWVERDQDPATEIQLSVTARTDRARIHLACHGKASIKRAWEFGPIEEPADDVSCASPHARALPVDPLAPVTATFDHLVPNLTYGIGWSW